MLDCIILAGGVGMKEISGVPKGLIRVNNKEIIAHQIDYLKDKVRKIIVALGYKGEDVEEFLYDTYPELAIVCIQEHQPLGTAGAIKNCMDEVETERFLVVNCDDICDIKIEDIEKIKGDVICVHNPTSQFGLIQENTEDSKALGKYSFVEKPVLKGLWTSCGWYLLQKDTVKYFPTKGSIEYNVFPKLDFNIFKHTGKWHTFNSVKDIEEFEVSQKEK